RHAAPGNRGVQAARPGPDAAPDATWLAVPPPPRGREHVARRDRARFHLLARRRPYRATLQRLLSGRLQHRGVRPGAHVTSLLAPRLRARARESRGRGRAGASDLVSPGARQRVIPVAVAGRLDAIVHAALPGLSRRVVRSLIAEGAVRVDGHRAPKGA